MKVAHRISELSRPAIMMAKESVNKSYEMSLAEGIKFERRLFHSTFATDDQKEEWPRSQKNASQILKIDK